jgi:putative transposase
LIVSLWADDTSNYINRTYERTGTLWDNRYKSLLLQAEIHLVLCQCGIELNPVRARMVSDPRDFPWSSLRTNTLGQANAILSPDPFCLDIPEPR